MSSPIIVTPNQIKLSNFKLNQTGYLITFSLMIVTILIPVIASVFFFSFGGKPSFRLFIFWTIFGFIAYFFYRLLTWNKYGKENFILEEDKLVYKPEAKNISYKTIEFKLENLVISSISSSDQVNYMGVNQNIAWLKLTDGENTIQTNIRTPQSVILEIIAVFESWGIKNDLFLEELKD